MTHIYLCIDLKSFYASVECVERNLDPLKTNLVVADPSRQKGTICLAITPKLKEQGLKNRCRLYEIPSHIPYIIAKPRMKKYITYSANIYELYLKYFSKEDIHVYSIDEVFIDVTNYLSLYQKTPISLAKALLKEIYLETGITATAGIGTNLYLAKIALDIIAKHNPANIGYLDEALYKQKLWYHQPLTDFWQIGEKIALRLNKLNIYTMHDLATTNENLLFQEFGINARLLIDHSKGLEPTTIKDIKNYTPTATSLSTSQVLFHDYSYTDARKVLLEMLNQLLLDLCAKEAKTSCLFLGITYTRNTISPLKITKKLKQATASYQLLSHLILNEYQNKVNKIIPIRRISLSFGNLTKNQDYQLSFFSPSTSNPKLEQNINYLKDKYGKNIILRAISYTSNATALTRNTLIGGHNAE